MLARRLIDAKITNKPIFATMDPVSINDYTYALPDDRIASFPLENRDQSKLLIYRDGTIKHSHFGQIMGHLPDRTVLFFNDTKVIPARLLFKKKTGATIELFLLTPHRPVLVQQAMETTGAVEWKCVIGNKKRWPQQLVLSLQHNELQVNAELLDEKEDIVRLTWSPPHRTFSEVVSLIGATPLPPYIKRQVTRNDRERYQTVYAVADGAVAAPTAGLHFTPSLLKKIADRGIGTSYVTLHVSAGTFQPVKTENAVDHTMHTEQIRVSKAVIQQLLEADHPVVAVGTTSLRTLESLYWFGTRLLNDPSASFSIAKLEPYGHPSAPQKFDAFTAILNFMELEQIEVLHGQTSILILPGYQFKVVDALITNFHQPGSTLMLLVAAFVGSNWKQVYQSALDNDYRFLSYGDSSLLFHQP